MDPLTHILVGASVADVLSAPRRLGSGATWFSMFMAAAPDVDMAPALVVAFPANPFTSALFDQRTALLYHRGWTHALPVMLIAGLAAGLAMNRLYGKGGNASGWIALAWTSLLAHSVLDMANGPVRFWLPFRDGWMGWSAATEGNPLILLMLAVCFATNHPYEPKREPTLGTARAVAGFCRRLQSVVGSRIGPAALAGATLAAAALVLLAAHLRG